MRYTAPEVRDKIIIYSRLNEIITKIFYNIKEKLEKVTELLSKCNPPLCYGREPSPVFKKLNYGQINNLNPTNKRKTAITVRNLFWGILSTIRLAIFAPKNDIGTKINSPFQSILGSSTPPVK